MRSAFSLLEMLLVLLLIGILLSIGIPHFRGFEDAACLKKLQLQSLNLRLKLKAQLNAKSGVDWEALYANLDLRPSSCNFLKQKNGFVVNYKGKKAYFTLKNSKLECQHTKSARLHNGESMCDVF